MERFETLVAVAAPLVRANVDTDSIIPSREMKSVSKKGLAEGLFAGWRYTEIGGRVPNPDFVLNRPDYREAKIILGGENFGCGSSREHAVWALHEYGIRAIIAPSFAPIFYQNCVRNGLLPVRLPADVIAALATAIEPDPRRHRLRIELDAQLVTGPEGAVHAFDIEREAKQMLLEGLDAIDLTMRERDAITDFHARDRVERPWVYLLADPVIGEE